MPAVVAPFTVLALRQLEGIAPENRFWLAFRVCSWFREDHSAGSDPVSVLLLRLMCFKLLLPDQEAGNEPAQAREGALSTCKAHCPGSTSIPFCATLRLSKG